ncbi:MAG TPA: ABC transporter ATP-binding protein [Micropepsaceae bacterium]|nr:ABC transporter ATP-binding protein [Micropepsaceae bacterium]
MTASPTNPAIEIDEVWKTYSPDGGFVLCGVSLAVEARSFVALTGTSGSGKTTLLKLINRLIEPSRGTVRVEGADIAATNAVLLRRRIGYVFQGVGLFPHLTVAENISITPTLLKWDRSAIARRVDELLDLVQLPRALNTRLPPTLSGGQAQRVGLARALAAKPGIVLMDEPFGAVDPITRDALGRDYRALHDALGLTTIMISHDMMEAVLLADRIAVMDSGEVVEYGETADLLSRPRHNSVRRLMRMPLEQAERVGRLAGLS